MPIEWKQQGNKLFSDCGRYIIENRGAKRGRLYCLYEYSDDLKAHCILRRIGTYQQAKAAAKNDND